MVLFNSQLREVIGSYFSQEMNRSRLDQVCWIIFCVRPPLIEKGIIKKIIAEGKKKKIQRRLAELKLAPKQQWTGIAIPDERRGRKRGRGRKNLNLWKKKRKTVVNTFFLPSLSFVGFHEGFTILPHLLWC